MSRMNPQHKGERFSKYGVESAKQSGGTKVNWRPHESSRPKEGQDEDDGGEKDEEEC